MDRPRKIMGVIECRDVIDGQLQPRRRFVHTGLGTMGHVDVTEDLTVDVTGLDGLTPMLTADGAAMVAELVMAAAAFVYEVRGES